MTTAPMRRSASNFAAAARSAVGSIVTTLPRLSAKMFLTNMVASCFRPPNPRCRLWATIRPEAGFRQETVQCEKKPFQGNAAVIWARNPFCRRMCCDIDPDRVSTLQPNDDQGIQQVEAIWSEQRADPSQQCPARGFAASDLPGCGNGNGRCGGSDARLEAPGKPAAQSRGGELVASCAEVLRSA